LHVLFTTIDGLLPGFSAVWSVGFVNNDALPCSTVFEELAVPSQEVMESAGSCLSTGVCQFYPFCTRL